MKYWSLTDASEKEETDVESLLESLKQRVDGNVTIPTCISSKVFFCQTITFHASF